MTLILQFQENELHSENFRPGCLFLWQLTRKIYETILLLLP